MLTWLPSSGTCECRWVISDGQPTSLDVGIDAAASAAAPGRDAPPPDELRRWVRDADPVALLLTAAHLTGDMGLLRDEWRPRLTVGSTGGGGYPDEVRSDIGYAALAALEKKKARGDWDRTRPTSDVLRRVVEWAMGEGFTHYAPLLADTLSFGPGDDPGRPAWHFEAIGARRDFTVAIVGAGESGLLLAHRLKQAGVPVVVLERNADVGGTWHDNAYPGCRVDLPSTVYEYSCHPGSWDSHFAPQPAIRDYLRDFARRHGLYEHIEFGSEVVSSRWDDGSSTWVLTVRSDGTTREVRAAVQVSAVGQLNRPHIPDIAGADGFTGPSFHTARWDHSVDLTGRRVGVIGTGASGIQLIPEIADPAAEVRVFARTPAFLAPVPNLRKDLGEAERALVEQLPHYRAWLRAVEVLPIIEGALAATIVDPAFPPTERAVSALNESAGALMKGWIDAQTGDDPRLRAALTPRFPYGAKRWVADDGTWISTLKRPDVHLVDDPIEAITPTGVRCAGTDHEVDVLIYATGFRAAEFLAPMRVVGRGGVELSERWSEDDARAYLGACVPEFPNLFILYGPNMSQVVHGVSIFFVSECAVRYVLDAVRVLLESGSSTIEVRSEVARAYGERLDAASAMRAWGYSAVSSWYKNSTGRSTQLWPFSAMELWQRTNRLDPAEFELRGS